MCLHLVAGVKTAGSFFPPEPCCRYLTGLWLSPVSDLSRYPKNGDGVKNRYVLNNCVPASESVIELYSVYASQVN